MKDLLRAFTSRMNLDVRHGKQDHAGEIIASRYTLHNTHIYILTPDGGVGTILSRSSKVPEIDRMITFCNDLCRDKKLKK